MTRRAMAVILLLAAVATCASQGLSMTLCRCTGHVFVGAAPESCCGACPEDESPRLAKSLSAAEPLRCLPSTENCFIIMAKGWETYPPANGKEEAPTPTVAIAEPLAALMMPHAPRQMPTGLLSWNLTHELEPPGPSRVLLYRSLLI